MSASEFKAKCLAFLDEQRGESITVTRRGLLVAVPGPGNSSAWKSPKDSWSGKAKIVGDIVNADTSSVWEILR